MNQDMKSLERGWTYCEVIGAAYHFEHIPLSQAEEMASIRDNVIVLETINWTLADEQTVHFNKYFAWDMSSAIAFAVQMEIDSLTGIAEDLVCIRPATKEEAEPFQKVSAHLKKTLLPAISEEQAVSLLKEKRRGSSQRRTPSKR